MKIKQALIWTGLILFPCLGLMSPSLAEETSYTKSTETYKSIRQAIERIRIIDDHEHLLPEKVLIQNGAPDFFNLVMGFYVGADVNNIGNTFPHDRRFRDRSLSVEERWESFSPVYERLKNTGYWRAIKLGFKKVHGIEPKDAASLKKIISSMDNLYKPGLYKKVFYDLGNMDCLLVYRIYKELDEDWYPDFIKMVRYIDNVIIFTKPEDLYDLEERYDVAIHSPEDFETVYRRFVEESIQDGVVGFKSAAAYIRSLDYSHYSREEAESQLKKLLTFTKAAWKQGEALSVKGGTQLTNYCMHVMLKIIEEKGLPISFHTGLQTAGKNDIRWCNPQLLIPLFREYKNLNFDIFHGGFPYLTEFVELGKSWPNVYLNLCWNHIISPEGTRALLSEMLECVPVHKIFAFGADTRFPEAVIGHLEMAKENCALVLADKVLNGYFSEEEAIEYAQRILRTNLIEFFKLKLPER